MASPSGISRPGFPECSGDSARHRSLCLGQTHNGKTTTVHIPADLEPLVREWAANFRQASLLLEELSQQGRKRLAKTKDRKAARTPQRTPAPLFFIRSAACFDVPKSLAIYLWKACEIADRQ